MGKLKIAVVGAGLIGRRHAAMIEASEECVLSAIVDPAAAGRAFAAERGVEAFEGLQDLFRENRPDGVILAGPNHTHLGHGLACIAAGVPAIVEKPVAHSLAAGQRLLQAAENVGARMLVGHHRRYGSIVPRAAEVIQSGAIGRVVAVVGTALFRKPDEGYFDGPYAWRRAPGGGPILINLIHEIDNLRALVGEIVEIQALASNTVRLFEVEDTVAINLRFANGALGTFMLSDTAASDRSWEHASGEDAHNFGAAHADDADCYLISGTDGSLAIPTMRLQTYGEDVERSWRMPMERQTMAKEAVDPLAAQIAHFCAVIRGEAEPKVTVRDGVANLKVIAALTRSMETGAAVQFED